MRSTPSSSGLKRPTGRLRRLKNRKEVRLNWNKWIRQTHRWLSIAFTVAVIVNGVAVARGRYSSRMGLLAVFVLALQFSPGLYLSVLPYAAKWGSGRRTD